MKRQTKGENQKLWKLSKEKYRMVLGRDVALVEVFQLSLLVPVGKFSYKSIEKIKLGWWMEET